MCLHWRTWPYLPFVYRSLSSSQFYSLSYIPLVYRSDWLLHVVIAYLCFVYRFDRLLYHTVFWCDHGMFGHGGSCWQQDSPLHATEPSGHPPQYVQICLGGRQESTAGTQGFACLLKLMYVCVQYLRFIFHV